MTEPEQTEQADASRWQNRIIGEAIVDPAELAANPLNFRTHGIDQQRALTGAIERLGWIQRVIVNKRTGLIVDGHLRAKLAQRHNQPVPVIYVDLDEEEERIALSTLDPIAAMAGRDDANLAALLQGIESGNAQLDAFLDHMRADLAGNRAPKPGKTDPDAAPRLRRRRWSAPPWARPGCSASTACRSVTPQTRPWCRSPWAATLPRPSGPTRRTT